MSEPSSNSIVPSTKRKNKPRKPKIAVVEPPEGAVASEQIIPIDKPPFNPLLEQKEIHGSVVPAVEEMKNVRGTPPWATSGGPVLPDPKTQTKEEWLAGKPKDPTKRRKIAIVGSAPSSNRIAPFHDPDWDIWACSPANMKILPRVDAWFEVHKTQLWPENIGWGEPYIEWLRHQSFTLYMQDKDLCPNATPYPIAKMIEEYSGYFFTSSFAYMLALAIYQDPKPEEIKLFGADMATTKEYIEQRPAAHHFMWLASTKGIKVSCPPESDIMQPPWLYGYFESTPKGRKWHVRKLEIENRVAHANQIIQQNMDEMKHLRGCLDAEDYHFRIWHQSAV